MDEISRDRQVYYHEMISSPMTDNTECFETLPYDYWEIFPNIPIPCENEIAEMLNVPGARHIFIFYRNNSVIVVPMPATIEGEGEEYAEPIKAMRRLLEAQRKERTVSNKMVDILNIYEVEKMLEDNNIDIVGAGVLGTYTYIGIEMLAKVVADCSLEAAKLMVNDYKPTSLIGPKTPEDAVLFNVKNYIDKSETYLMDLVTFGEHGMYLTKLGELAEQKMEQWRCSYDKVSHGLSELYVDTVDLFIEELMDERLSNAKRAHLRYKGILSPNFYNHKTDQLIVEGGELGEILKAITVSEYYYDWLEYVRVITTETDSYVPYHQRVDFDRHIRDLSKGQKSSLLSYCARLTDKEGLF